MFSLSLYVSHKATEITNKAIKIDSMNTCSYICIYIIHIGITLISASWTPTYRMRINTGCIYFHFLKCRIWLTYISLTFTLRQRLKKMKDKNLILNQPQNVVLELIDSRATCIVQRQSFLNQFFCDDRLSQMLNWLRRRRSWVGDRGTAPTLVGPVQADAPTLGRWW